MRKIIAAVLSVFIMICSLCTASYAGSDDETHGYCGAEGENVSWHFDDTTGTLTISGSGRMYNYWEYDKIPWAHFKDEIKKVVFDEGVTNVSECGFNYWNIEEIVLHDGMTGLHQNSFWGTAARRSPDYLDEYGAFYVGNYLIDAGYVGGSTGKLNDSRHYVVREGTKYIVWDAFDGPLSGFGPGEGLVDTVNYDLETIVIPTSVTYIAPYIFELCWSFGTVLYRGTQEQWDQIENHDVTRADSIKFNYVDNPFADVPDGKWYTESVLYCSRMGLLSGVADGSFAPATYISRAMFVTVLSRIDRAVLSQYTGTSFTDVEEGQWYAKPIEWAYRNGLTAGVGGGRFGVSEPLTREQLSTFLYAYFFKIALKNKHLEPMRLDYLKKDVDISKYSDFANTSKWAEKPMKWAVSFGLISGTSANTLSPKAYATRAQAAVIVDHFYSDIMIGCRCYY